MEDAAPTEDQRGVDGEHGRACRPGSSTESVKLGRLGGCARSHRPERREHAELRYGGESPGWGKEITKLYERKTRGWKEWHDAGSVFLKDTAEGSTAVVNVQHMGGPERREDGPKGHEGAQEKL